MLGKQFSFLLTRTSRTTRAHKMTPRRYDSQRVGNKERNGRRLTGEDPCSNNRLPSCRGNTRIGCFWKQTSFPYRRLKPHENVCTAEYDHRCLFTRVVCTSRALFTTPLNSSDVQIVNANQYVQQMFRGDGWALASFARP